MADLHALPGAGAPLARAQAVDGWNRQAERDAAPPVVVNPLCSDLALCDWARGQFETVLDLLDELMAKPTAEARGRDFLCALSHVQAQAISVIVELQRRLEVGHTDGRTSGSSR